MHDSGSCDPGSSPGIPTRASMKNEKLINFLLEHNKKQSEEFSTPDAALQRAKYRAQHPTEIAAWKCMDGRLHLPIITKTPLGIIQPFRNIGGQFDLGWPFFGLLMKEWVDYALSRGRDSMILVTYHFSKSDTHLGCKGFGYDTKEAFAFTANLVKQVERVFGGKHTVVYPLHVGIETDEDALVLHGSNGDTLDLAQERSPDEETLRFKLRKIFPDMRNQMLEDLLPLLLGNICHIAQVRKINRPPHDIDHKEQILGVGRGFDWLHLHNKALLVGPFSYNLQEPIGKAAGILLDNLKKKRIPEDEGVVLIASAVYREEVGIERQLAFEKANSLAQLGVETIRTQVPELIPHLNVLVGTVDLNTREFRRLPFEMPK